MTFKFEISILGQQMKMDINNFEFIYLSIMDAFHSMIYLFIYLIQIINEIHPFKNDIHLWDIFIHVSGLKSH